MMLTKFTPLNGDQMDEEDGENENDHEIENVSQIPLKEGTFV